MLNRKGMFHPGNSNGRLAPVPITNTEEMNGANAVDASSFFLLEATGDSEADFNSDTAFASTEDGVDAVAVVDDQDDAQSCSCDLSDRTADVGVDAFDNLDHDDVQDYVQTRDDESNHHNDGEVEEEEDDGGVDQACCFDRKKSKSICVDSSHSEMELKKERDKERDRLFWETCLAS